MPNKSRRTTQARSAASKKRNPPKANARTTWRNVILNGKTLYGSAHYGQSGSWSLGSHTGQDFGVASGSSVRAPLAGVVTYAGYDSSYGNSVIVKMKDGYYVRYAHLSSIGVRKGSFVPNGGFVGKSGSTGRSSGPHLHVEVMTPQSGGRFGRGNFVNPVSYFDRRGKNIPLKTTTGYAQDLTGPDDYTAAAAALSNNSGTFGSTGAEGGGITGVAGFTKKDYYRWLDAKFGSIKELRRMDKEARDELGGKSIDWLVDKLAKEKVVDPSIVASYMNKTGWFKKYGAEASLRLVAEKARPGKFEEEVSTYLSSVQAALDALGVTLSPQALKQISRDAYVYNWDAARVLDEAQKSYADTGEVSYDGGAIGEAEDSLQSAAWELGVDLTEEDLRRMRQDVIDGKGYQSQLDDLRERSAQMYSVFGEQIRAGKSLRDVGAAYFQKAADLLELGSPDQVDVNDPLFSGGSAFMAADPGSGKMVPKGLWEFEKDVKKDARWLDTKNARSDTFQRSGEVLQLMGLM